MRITKRQLRRIIKEEILKEHDPGSRGAPGHRDPESGNWQFPGDPGYNPRKDKSLRGCGPEEYSEALRAHSGGRVDPNWVHPADRAAGGKW